MKYTGYELDENGRAIICPRCENEEINGGEYCKICGISIINKCTRKEFDWNGNLEFECNEIAEGNARYCIHCGGETAFLVNNLLQPWDERQQKLETASTLNDDTPF